MTALDAAGAPCSRALLGVLIALGSAFGRPALAQTAPEQPTAQTDAVPAAADTTGGGATPAEPALPPTRPWSIVPSVTMQESVTDNVWLAPTQRQADLISAVTPDLAVSGQTRRLTLSLDANLTYDKYLSATALDGIQYAVNGYGNAELVDKLLYLDMRSAIDVQPLMLTGPISAESRVLPTNQAEVINNSISPYLRHDFGDWASGELRYTLATINYANAGAGMPVAPANSIEALNNLSNAVTNEYTVGLHSGPTFGRVNWGVDGDYSQASYSAQRQIDQSTETTTLEYDFIHEFGVIGKVGYDGYRDSAFPTTDTSNPSWRLGFRLTPGPRSSLTFEAGSRFGGPYWAGKLYYKFSPTLRLDASHDIAQVTQQALMTMALTSLVPNNLGQLVSPITGLPTSPNQQLFSYIAPSFLQKTSRMTISGQRGLTTVVFGVTYQENDIGTASLAQGAMETQSVLESDLSVTYQLNRHSDIRFGGSTSRLFDTIHIQEATIGQATLSYDYKLSPSLTGSLAYSYYTMSNKLATSYYENIFMISLRKAF